MRGSHKKAALHFGVALFLSLALIVLGIASSAIAQPIPAGLILIRVSTYFDSGCNWKVTSTRSSRSTIRGFCCV